ncbi:MAG TPA: hypothetical protein PKY50_03775 [Candidatus Competibacter sp.]|nr:hypothetical protein [Candidatus Competibacter sp.]
MDQQDGSSPKEQVSLSELTGGGSGAKEGQVPLKGLGEDWRGVVRERPTFQQFKGAYLAEMVLWFIFGLLAIMLLAWCATYPNVADLEAVLGKAADGSTMEIGKERLQALQSLRSEHANAFRDLFQLAVASVLVPIFTLLAGYAFGSREAEKAGNQQK